MNAAGFPTRGGSGNGAPPRANRVVVRTLYRQCCAEIEAAYPRLTRERTFEQIEAYMVVCSVEDDARHLGGVTWLMTTPDGFEPRLMIYFTYAAGQIALQAVHATEY